MKSVFFCYPNVHQLATSYNETIRVRQGERERERGKKPHERRLRLHLSFWRCNSQPSKLSSLEGSISFCGLLSLIVCPTFFSIKSRPNAILQKRLSISYLQEHQFSLFSMKSCFQLAYTCCCTKTEIQILL